jgi:hypothetical protein
VASDPTSSSSTSVPDADGSVVIRRVGATLPPIVVLSVRDREDAKWPLSRRADDFVTVVRCGGARRSASSDGRQV